MKLRDFVADFLWPAIFALGTLALIVGAVHSCAQIGRQRFREDCERRGWVPIDAYANDGRTILVCRPPGDTGVLVLPDWRRVFMPRHQ